MDWLRRVIFRLIHFFEWLAGLAEVALFLPFWLALAFLVWLYWPELTRRQEKEHDRE